MRNIESPCIFEKREDTDTALRSVIQLVTRRLPGFLGCDPLKDIQVMAPMKRGELGVHNLNTHLQAHCNPPSARKTEINRGGVIFREGDRVMQVKNNYTIQWSRQLPSGSVVEDEGLFNGDVGFIDEIDADTRTVTVTFDDGRVCEYDGAALEELELAYAISIHKGQGSEFPVVVLPLVSGPPMLMNRNLLYTAISRAKKLVMVVGRKSCIAQMVKNTEIRTRYSGLVFRLDREKRK